MSARAAAAPPSELDAKSGTSRQHRCNTGVAPASSVMLASNLTQIWCREQRSMLDISNDIDSLSNFKRNTPEFLRQLKATGHPVVLTINGKAELVVQDTASYQKLIELAERAERMDALQASIEDMKAGRVIAADDVLAEMRQFLGGNKGQ